MRPVTHQDAASLQLLKTLLEALTPRGEEAVDGGEARLEDPKAPQPPAPPSPAKAPPGRPPGFNKPASVAAEAVAAQVLATLMAEQDAAPGAVGGVSRDPDGSEDSERFALLEPASAQPKPGAAHGPVPWPTEALAAYSARPREVIGLQPGASPSGLALGGGFASGRAKPNTLKLFRRAMLYACVLAVVIILLNRRLLFG